MGIFQGLDVPGQSYNGKKIINKFGKNHKYIFIVMFFEASFSFLHKLLIKMGCLVVYIYPMCLYCHETSPCGEMK
jgi:hypothetical protein